MHDYGVHLLVLIVAIFVSSCSQILLKLAAKNTYNRKYGEYLNIYVIFAYSLFAITVLMGMYVLRHIPLVYVPIIETLGYIFVPMLSSALLKEKMNKQHILGMIIITLGIVIFSV